MAILSPPALKRVMRIYVVLVTFFNLKCFVNSFQSNRFFQIHLSSTTQNRLVVGEIPVCTYEDLSKSFPPRNIIFSQGKSCWALSRRILHIPLEATVTTRKIGGGAFGAVYKAFIRLNKRNDFCLATLKTDVCRREGARNYSSCLYQNSFRFRYDNITDKYITDKTSSGSKFSLSFMGSEYLGSFPYIAARTAGVNLSGMVPTLGIVYGKTPVRSIQGTPVRGRPHPNPTVRGIVMPFVSLKSLNELSTKGKRQLTKYISTFAALLLAPLNALLFLQRLGLSHQDIHIKNFGLVHNYTSNATSIVLYDNTFLSLVKNASCYVHGNSFKNSCTFCSHKNLSSEQASLQTRLDVEGYMEAGLQGHLTNEPMLRREECSRMVKVIHRLLEPNLGSSDTARSFLVNLQSLRSTNSCTLESLKMEVEKVILFKDGVLSSL